MENPTQPQKITDTREATGDLDSGFFCDLVGVTTQFPKKPSSNTGDLRSGDLHSGSLVPLDASGDLETIPQDDIDAVKTKIPLYKQGGIKTLMLLGLVAIPIAGMGAILFGGNSEPAAEAAKKPTPAASTPPQAELSPDRRFGEVQSKLAMQQQEKLLLEAAQSQEQARLAKEVAAAGAAKTAVDGMGTQPAAAATLPETPNQKPTLSQDVGSNAPVVDPPPPTNVEPPIVPAAPVTPVAIPTPPSPRIITRTKIVTITKPAPRPVLVASRSPNKVLPARATAAKTPSAIQPVSWQQATAAGVAVFGTRSPDAAAPTPVISAPPAVPTPTLEVAQVPQIAAQNHRIIPGQNRLVSLVIPIQILAGEPAQEVLLNLEQGFVDMQGRMLLPAGTKLLAQVNVANNGLLRIAAAKALVGNAEYSIPAGNLMLSGQDNAPVFAQLKQFGQDEIGRRDLRTFLMGAAQGIGEVLTQPSSNTQVFANGTAISTTDNNQNIVGGVLKGGASPLVQQWLQRNQREIERIDGATRLWHLPAGFKLSLYAVRPFEVK